MVMSIIWAVIFIISLMIEISLPALVSIWFTAGSLAALILSIFIGDTLIWLQILLFAIVTVITLLLLRPIMFKNKGNYQSNVDSLIGKIAICTEDISKYNSGLIKIDGLVWTAIFDDSEKEEIKKDDLVIITKVDGNKLLVKKYLEDK